MNPRSQQLLRKYFPDGGPPVPKGGLPLTVVRWLATQVPLNAPSIAAICGSQRPLIASLENSTLEVNFIFDHNSQEELLLLVEHTLFTSNHTLLRSLGLTDRESEVLFWVQEGKTSADIACICAVHERTVHKHLENIYRKLSVPNRAAAASIAAKVLSRVTSGYSRQ